MGINHQRIDIVTAYDAALLVRIAKVQGNARTVHNLVYSAVCVLLVVLGLQAGYETARGIILIAAGCILLPLSNYSVRRKARDEAEALGGKRKLVRYQFDDQKVIANIGQSGEEIQYDQIQSSFQMLSEKYKCDQPGKTEFLVAPLDNGHFITECL